MDRWVLVVAVMCVAAGGCSSSGPAAEWPPPEYAEFVIERGDSVIATERTTRSLDRLRGEISMPGRGTARYTALLTGPGTVTSVEATLRSWTGPGEEGMRVELLGDSVRVTSSRWNALPQTLSSGASAAYLHPSPALLEILLRRALLSGDTVATVRVWLMNQNAPADARYRLSGGETSLELAGTRVRIVHENGYLLLAEVPSLGWTVRRR